MYEAESSAFVGLASLIEPIGPALEAFNQSFGAIALTMLRFRTAGQMEGERLFAEMFNQATVIRRNLGELMMALQAMYSQLEAIEQLRLARKERLERN